MSTASNFFFDDESQTRGQSCDYFRGEDISKHLEVLRTSVIGRFLCNLTQKEGIKINRNWNLPENTEALYISSPIAGKFGHFEIGNRVHATLLGHEMRHFWQDFSGIRTRMQPISAEEYILMNRFIEADARAIELGITIQVAASLRLDNDYASHLVACLDHEQKRILEYDVDKLERAAHEPALMKQILRQGFDNWIVLSPAQKAYDERTETEIREQEKAERSIRYRLSGGARRHSKAVEFTATGLRPAFVATLVEALGVLPPGEHNNETTGGGNYLIESKGLDFADSFYTRICNHRIEYLTTPARQQAGKDRLLNLHL